MNLSGIKRGMYVSISLDYDGTNGYGFATDIAGTVQKVIDIDESGHCQSVCITHPERVEGWWMSHLDLEIANDNTSTN